jgi:hypothetical protein
MRTLTRAAATFGLVVLSQLAAAQPAAFCSVNGQNVFVQATLASGPTNWHCTYNFTVTFKDGTSTADGCATSVSEGSQNLVVCQKTYGKAVASAALTGQNCSPG